MISLSKNFQQTINDKINFEGVGLHSGIYSKLTLHPAPTDYGIKFLIDGVIIPATIDYVNSTVRGTNLSKNNISIMTVEHLLSALYALEIDNLKIEILESEIPILDGTSQFFVQEINKIGLKIQDKKCKEFIVDRAISFKSSKGIQFYLIPSDNYKFTYHLQYDNIDTLNQKFSISLNGHNYQNDIASCKTFCLLSELLHLYNLDLIKGGSLKNAVVYIDQKISKDQEKQVKKLFNIDIDYSKPILNNVNPIFKDEAARHKLLDLIGDTYLLGFRIKGHLIANKSGHESNIEFIKYLHNNFLNSNLHAKKEGDNMYNINQILDIMPHRYPFLLVDKILSVKPGEKVRSIKNVTFNEPFFQGHFPEQPIMPGVLILEAMAQTGGFLVLNSIPNPETKLIYFSGINNSRFKKTVVPGDQIFFEAKLEKFRMGTCKISAIAKVDDELVCEAELLASIVDRES